MINPSEVGKSGEMARLRTLESIWIQGKLRMWGRWSYIGGGSGGNMFNQLLASGKITKTAINEALRRMKKAGISKPELEAFFKEIQEGNNKAARRSVPMKKRWPSTLYSAVSLCSQGIRSYTLLLKIVISSA